MASIPEENASAQADTAATAEDKEPVVEENAQVHEDIVRNWSWWSPC